MNSNTLVLLGDSILDNAPYTDPDSTAHLRRLLPEWTVHRVAQDGATMSNVQRQFREFPVRPSVAVLSVGGNDVVEHIGLLEQRETGSARLPDQLLGIAESFEPEYAEVAGAVASGAGRTVL